MRKGEILLITFGLLMLFVCMTVSVDKIRKSGEVIEDLENTLAREKAAHSKTAEDRKMFEDKTVELYAKINGIENELGQAQWDLATERENHNATKADQHSQADIIAQLTEEVETLKKKRASIVDKRKKVEPIEKEEAKPSKANEGGREIDMRVTAYGADCVGCEGKTASGTNYTEGRTLACPPQYKFGTKIEIPSLGGTYICEDRGGAIKGNTFDMFYGMREADTAAFGVKNVKGYIRE
ncbi:3D domain-containing protein (plasmid) [Bacillus mycoides]|nr:3D domain-containing protein [Bacillus mycoides]